MTLPELRGITPRELVGALERDGFRLVTIVGSHHVFVGAAGRKVVVAFHSRGATFPPGTLHAILKRTGWEMTDLVRLGLLRRRSERPDDGQKAA